MEPMTARSMLLVLGILATPAVGQKSKWESVPEPSSGTGVLPYVKELASGNEIWVVDAKTAQPHHVLTVDAFLPIELTGYAVKDRLRQDLPSLRGEGAGRLQLTAGGSLYWTRRAGATELLLVRAQAEPRVLFSAPEVSAGVRATLPSVHVSPSQAHALVATNREAGGDVFSVQLTAPFEVRSLTTGLAPRDWEAESLRISDQAAWFVADGELFVSPSEGAAQLVDFDNDHGVAPELHLAAGGGAVAALLEKPDGKRRVHRVDATGQVTEITTGFHHISRPGLKHPLGPFLAISPDASIVAYRKEEGDSHELYVWRDVLNESEHLSEKPAFPDYLDSIGVLVFGGPTALCFFGGDSITGDFEQDTKLGDADMYVAHILDNGEEGLALISNVTRTNGSLLPPFAEGATLDFDEALVGPRSERIFLVGTDAAGLKQLSCFRIDGGTDPLEANDQLLLEDLLQAPDLVPSSAGVVILSSQLQVPHAQNSNAVECEGDPSGEPLVFIRATEKSNPDDTGGKVWFEGEVGLGESFVLDAALAGENKLKSDTYLHVFDLGGQLLQSVKFHTSCSQTLRIDDRFGAGELVGAVAEHASLEEADGFCQYNIKPASLVLRYTGTDCSASAHDQSGSKASCDDEETLGSLVRIRVSDKGNPTDDKAKVWFEEVVAAGELFVADSAAAGEIELKEETWVHVLDLGGELLQKVKFHSSCSEPLRAGDLFGSVEVVDCVLPSDPFAGDACAGGKPRRLTMTYTGGPCGLIELGPTVRGLQPLNSGTVMPQAASQGPGTPFADRDGAGETEPTIPEPYQFPIGTTFSRTHSSRSGGRVAFVANTPGGTEAYLYDLAQDALLPALGGTESPALGFWKQELLVFAHPFAEDLYGLVLSLPSGNGITVDVSAGPCYPLAH